MLWQITRLFAAIIIVVSIANDTLAQDTNTTTQTVPNVEYGQFIVKFSESGITIRDVARIFREFGVQILDTLPPSNIYHIELSEIPTTDELSAWNNNPVIEYIEPVYKFHVLLGPNDPYYKYQWGFRQIKAPETWGSGIVDSKDSIVAVIDTGVDYTHRDLAANMWRNNGEKPNNRIDDDGNGIKDDVFGADFSTTGSVSGDPMDDYGHGTHVAGIIGAVSNNKLGVAGTVWKTRIMALKFTKNGKGSSASVGQAIYYAIENKADVINASFGGPDSSRYVEDAIKGANNAGILFVAAAGNDNSDNDKNPIYPANYNVPNVMSIMASDEKNRRAKFSNYGKNTVDIAAPGDIIYSTSPGDRYTYMSGTSMAAPYVAGAAALVKVQIGTYGWSPEIIKKHLIDRSRRIWHCKKPGSCFKPDLPNEYICALDLYRATHIKIPVTPPLPKRCK